MLTIRVIDYANREFVDTEGSESTENTRFPPILWEVSRNDLHLPNPVMTEWGVNQVFLAISTSKWEKQFVFCQTDYANDKS